jgi:hypothetical protein
LNGVACLSAFSVCLSNNSPPFVVFALVPMRDRVSNYSTHALVRPRVSALGLTSPRMKKIIS